MVTFSFKFPAVIDNNLYKVKNIVSWCFWVHYKWTYVYLKLGGTPLKKNERRAMNVGCFGCFDSWQEKGLSTDHLFFRWNTIVLDGSDISAICKAFYDAEVTKGKPTMVLAQTYKGAGIPGIENEMNWHGKAIGAKADEAIPAIEARMSNKDVSGVNVNKRVVVDDVKEVDPSAISLSDPPSYAEGVKVCRNSSYKRAVL